MENKMLLVFGIIAAVVIVGAGFLFWNQTPTQPTQQTTGTEEQQITGNQKESQASTGETRTHIVEMSSTGFSPGVLKIKAGDTVIFKQIDGSKTWPASDFHPTHTIYPGSDIRKCGSGDKIFDSCRGLKEGESWSFTFNEKGSWNYHDHLNPKNVGTIVVE
jgi:plastocyanin